MSFSGKTRDQINSLMKGMVEMNGIQRLSCLLSIFDILSNTKEYDFLARVRNTPNKEKATDRLGKITEYVLENFDKKISLSEVASMANMAVTTFCNFFK